jgi:twitching motility two-component system response regulator PilH
VVDDGGADRQNMVNILTEAGCAVVSASNAVHAIALARERLPQIIFMDIVMPGMDGYQACRRLSEDPATRDIPVVFVSTKSHRADHLWARMQGGKALIAKPFTAEQLLAALQHANPPGH